MTIKDCFVCPVCGQSSVALISAGVFMSDVRVDSLKCDTCEAEWKLYSKVSEIQIDVTKGPARASEEVTSEQ